jgi:hypothetical protein
LINRWYKIFPHKVFSDVDVSVYIDGNIRILRDLDILIQEFWDSNAALGVFGHMERNTIFEEAEACRQLGKFDAKDQRLVDKQLNVYTQAGLPSDQRLTDNGIIFRRHKHSELAGVMDLWWTHLHEFTKRDQISLPYAIWKSDLPIKIWGWSCRDDKNGYFLPYKHLKQRTAMRTLVTFLSASRESSALAKFTFRAVSRLSRLRTR